MAKAIRRAKKSKPISRQTPASAPAVSRRKVSDRGKAAASKGQAKTRKESSAARRRASQGTSSRKAVGRTLPTGGERVLASPAVRAFEQAVKLFNRQEFERAREAFQSLIERFPTEAEVLARARAYLAICEQKLRAPRPVPRTAEALYDQGIVELNRGQIAPAIAYFEKALRLDPRADHAVYALAAAYARGGQVEKALAALRQAIAMRETYRLHARRDPDFLPLYANLEFQRLVGIEVIE